MNKVDDQILQGWKDYYSAIGQGRTGDAARIFERVSALAFVHTARRSTARLLAPVLEAK